MNWTSSRRLQSLLTDGPYTASVVAQAVELSVSVTLSGDYLPVVSGTAIHYLHNARHGRQPVGCVGAKPPCGVSTD